MSAYEHFMINEILWNLSLDLFYVLYSAAALGGDRPWWGWWKWPSPHHFPFKWLPALQLFYVEFPLKNWNTWHCKTVWLKRKHRCSEWNWIYEAILCFPAFRWIISSSVLNPPNLRPKLLFSVTPAHFHHMSNVVMVAFTLPLTGPDSGLCFQALHLLVLQWAST